jgi:hypothetical protein
MGDDMGRPTKEFQAFETVYFKHGKMTLSPAKTASFRPSFSWHGDTPSGGVCAMADWRLTRLAFKGANAAKGFFEWKAIVTSAVVVGSVTSWWTWATRDPAVALILGLCGFGAWLLVLAAIRIATEQGQPAAPSSEPEPDSLKSLERLIAQRHLAKVFEHQPGVPRHFTPRSVRELFSIVRDHTAVKSEPEVARQKGLWMNASGPVMNVREHADGVTCVILDVAPEVVVTGSITLFFAPSDRAVILALDKGDYVEATGEILNIDHLSITLKRCELMKVSPRPTL